MSTGLGDWFKWEAQVVGVARSSTGEVYNVRMKLQLQVSDVPAPEGARLEHIEFLSSPVKK